MSPSRYESARPDADRGISAHQHRRLPSARSTGSPLLQTRFTFEEEVDQYKNDSYFILDPEQPTRAGS